MCGHSNRKDTVMCEDSNWWEIVGVRTLTVVSLLWLIPQAFMTSSSVLRKLGSVQVSSD